MNLSYDQQMKEWRKRIANVMKLHNKGVPKAEIAKRLGVTRQRIQQMIAKEEAK